MKQLQEDIESWQYSRDGEWLSSLSIEKDDDKFYCIGVQEVTQIPGSTLKQNWREPMIKITGKIL